MSTEIKRIEAPNLIEFVKEIEEYVQKGYSVTDTNEGIPQSWGPGLYTCELAIESSEKPVEAPESTSDGAEESKATDTSSEPEKPVEKPTEAPAKPARKTRRKTSK